MPNPEPHRLSAAAIVRMIEAGELTAEAVARSCLDRIRERDPVVRAWAWLDPQAALAAARACDCARVSTAVASSAINATERTRFTVSRQAEDVQTQCALHRTPVVARWPTMR